MRATHDTQNPGLPLLAASALEALTPRTGECDRLRDAETRRADLGSIFYERWAAYAPPPEACVGFGGRPPAW